MLDQDQLHSIGWNHPRLGRIEELACPQHENAVLDALKTLGIGCTGRPAVASGECLRCAHDGQRPFSFLSGAADRTETPTVIVLARQVTDLTAENQRLRAQLAAPPY